MTDNPTPKNGHTDPTINVINILHEAVRRQDDLRIADAKYNDRQFISVSDMFVAVAKKFDDVDVKYQIQFSAAEKAIGIAQTAQEKLVASALDGTKEAINKADIATDKRFSLLSEKIDNVGETVSKSAGSVGIYVTHSDLSVEMEKLRNSFETMLRPVITFMNSQTGKGQGMSTTWGWIVAGVATILAVLGYLK